MKSLNPLVKGSFLRRIAGGLYYRLPEYVNIKRAEADIRSQGFWFVDIPRTSSTAIRFQLGAHLGKAYGKADVHGQENQQTQLIKDHRTADEMARALGYPLWNQLFTWTIVRNPWDRFYSIYGYRIKTGLLSASTPFRDFARMVDDLWRPDLLFPRMYWPATAYVSHPQSDQLIVNQIVRFEDRANGLRDISGKIGVPLDAGVRQQQSTLTNEYRNAYCDVSHDIVQRRYESDIQRFQYSF